MKVWYKDWHYWAGALSIWLGFFADRPHLNIISYSFVIGYIFTLLGIGLLYREQ